MEIGVCLWQGKEEEWRLVSVYDRGKRSLLGRPLKVGSSVSTLRLQFGIQAVGSSPTDED